MPMVIEDTLQNLARSPMAANSSAAKKLLASGFKVNALRTLGTLQKDEWVAFDTAVIEVARKRLVITQELIARGLTWNLPNALGHTSIEWEKVSDMEGAIITMSGISESQNDRVIFDLDSMPVPIIHKDFNINLRTLAASRNKGEALDVTQARYAARKVAETVETLIFDGATVLGTNKPIYGLTTAPYRNTGTLGETWLTASGTTIVQDVIAMISAAVGDNMYGPYMLFIGTGTSVRFSEDYKSDSDKSIMTRLMEIPELSGIKSSKDLDDGEVLLVQMTDDVIQLINGMQPTTVEWDTHAGFVQHFKILCIMIPRIRNDFINQSGIVHFTA